MAILGILALLVIGGILLRFKKAFHISIWKSLICFGCWIIGGSLVIMGILDGSVNPLWLLFVAVWPFVIIFGLQILGRFIKWALGGWSSNADK